MTVITSSYHESQPLPQLQARTKQWSLIGFFFNIFFRGYPSGNGMTRGEGLFGDVFISLTFETSTHRVPKNKHRLFGILCNILCL